MDKKSTYEELEQKIAKLEAQTERFKKFDLMPLFKGIESSFSMGITDRNGMVIYANDPLVKMWGYSSDKEMIGKWLPEFWEGDGIFRTIDDLINNGFSKGEDIGKKKDGSLFNAEYVAIMCKDNNDEPLYILGQFFDIKKRKQAEEALQQNEAKFRGLVESTSDWIWEVSAEGVYTYASPQVEVMLGYKPEEIVGKTPFDLMPAKDAEQIAAFFKNVSGKGEPIVSLENICLHKDGRHIVMETSAIPFFNEAGKVNGYRGVDRDITERKQAEERIVLLAEIADIAPNSILVHDFDGRMIYANERTFEMHGYEKDEFMVINLHDLDVPESEKLIARRMKLIDEEGEASFEVSHFRKDGSTFPMLVYVKKINWSGEPAMLSIGTDITDRKKHEDALKESEIKHKTLVNNIPGMVYRAYPDWSAEVISGSEDICGYTKKELMSKKDNWLSIIHDDDKENVFKIGSELTTVQKEIVQTYRIKTKDGHLRWVEDRKTSIFSEKGNFLGIDGAVFDITERKRNEVALRESEKKFRDLVEDINEVIYSIDAKGIVSYISPAVRRFFGYEPKNIIGKSYLDFVHPEDHLRVLKEFQEVLSGKFGYDEYRVLSKTGEYRWIRSSSKPIFDDSRLVGLRGGLSDITEEKRLRTDLQQAQKMEAIGTLAGGIAHEFNNILGIIIGNTELAVDDVPEWNPAKNCLEEIRVASKRAKDVVRQIMSFARKTPATQKPIQISTIVKESLKLIRATIPTSIEIHQEILSDSEMILANPTEINQILINLCSNSVHAMEEETGILEVVLETAALNDRSAAQYEDLTAGEYVKLTVKDTGRGISPEFINRIFDPYFTTKEVDKGLGMGLAVVFGIVKKQDGAIKFTSEVGKGTTAEILFPVTKVQAETKMEESDDLSSGTERILFVDDEASLVKIAKQMLERQGYEVVGKTSSTEALKLFQEESDKFDLIITDMAMPHMPGDRLTQEVIKISPKIPIILCTGHSDRIDQDSAKDLGISAYVTKPFDKRGLSKLVREVLDRTKS